MDLTSLASHVVDTRGGSSLLGNKQQVRRALERGELVRLRPGLYVRAATWAASTARERFALEALALSRSAPDTVFLGETALLLQGFDTLQVPRTIDVLEVSGGRAGRRPAVLLETRDGLRGKGGVPLRGRRVAWSPGETLSLAGLLTVPTAAALADVAAHETFPRALVAADSVARAAHFPRLVEAQGFAEAADALPYGLWRRRGAAVLGCATALSESVGESLSRAVILASGFEAPELQREVWDRGSFIARPDYTWPAKRIIGEFDGMAKYSDAAMVGERGTAGTIRAERERQRRLEELGFRVVRWEWGVAVAPEALAAVLRRAGLRQGDPMPDVVLWRPGRAR